jgi:hypothetical protein
MQEEAVTLAREDRAHRRRAQCAWWYRLHPGTRGLSAAAVRLCYHFALKEVSAAFARWPSHRTLRYVAQELAAWGFSERTQGTRPPACPRCGIFAYLRKHQARQAIQGEIQGLERSQEPRTQRDASWFRWWLLVCLATAAVLVFVLSVARVSTGERERPHFNQFNALKARNSRLATEVARLKATEALRTTLAQSAWSNRASMWWS